MARALIGSTAAGQGPSPRSQTGSSIIEFIFLVVLLMIPLGLSGRGCLPGSGGKLCGGGCRGPRCQGLRHRTERRPRPRAGGRRGPEGRCQHGHRTRPDAFLLYLPGDLPLTRKHRDGGRIHRDGPSIAAPGLELAHRQRGFPGNPTDRSIWIAAIGSGKDEPRPHPHRSWPCARWRSTGPRGPGMPVMAQGKPASRWC